MENTSKTQMLNGHEPDSVSVAETWNDSKRIKIIGLLFEAKANLVEQHFLLDAKFADVLNAINKWKEAR